MLGVIFLEEGFWKKFVAVAKQPLFVFLEWSACFMCFACLTSRCAARDRAPFSPYNVARGSHRHSWREFRRGWSRSNGFVDYFQVARDADCKHAGGPCFQGRVQSRFYSL